MDEPEKKDLRNGADVAFLLSVVIDPASCEDTLETMILAGSASSLLRLGPVLHTVRKMAYKRLELEKEKAAASLMGVVQTRLGSRQIRSFRVVRVRDATPADYGREGEVSEKRKNSERSALVKVWDYTDRAQEGNTVPVADGEHFLVSRLLSREGVS